MQYTLNQNYELTNKETRPDQIAGILDWCLQIRSGRIVPLGSVHPEADDVAGQIAQVARAGLIGIKMHPMYQGFAVDDDRAGLVFRAAAEQGLLVVLHCGQDIAYPGSDQADPIRIARVVDKYPDLRLVATHLGGWKSWDSVRKNLLGKPVYMETSFAVGWMDDAQAVEIIRAQGVENVFFGTDSPWADQKAEIDRVRNLPLTDAEKDMILGKNAVRILDAS
jgi:predicted TIM-barrel fold metal-dependent hydrolase